MSDTTHYVYTLTHPDDVSEHRSIFDAYEAMAELVEYGHNPVCESVSNVSSVVTVRGWSEVSAIVNGEG